MGLAIEVGILDQLRNTDEEGGGWFRGYFARLNIWLAGKGIPEHHEPEKLLRGQGYSCSMFGYSGLHTLRRIAAYVQLKERPPPTPMRQGAAKDPVVEEFYAEFGIDGSNFDHLMMHSDAEGFYLPRDFKSVLFPPDELKIPGCMVGSSVQLLAECTELAKAMNLPINTDPESVELGELLEDEDAQGRGWKRFPVEAYTCLHLILACRASIASGAAIVFT